MKNLFKLACALLISFGLHATDGTRIQTQLTHVTVFAQGAQLFHTASYSVKPGMNTVVLEGLSPQLDPKSIQVKLTGNVILLDTRHTTYFTEPGKPNLGSIPAKTLKDIQMLEDSISSISFELTDMNNELDVLSYTKQILTSNGAVRGQGKVNDSINLLKATIDYYQSKMNELNKKINVLNRQYQLKLTKLDGMKARLAQLKKHANYPDETGSQQQEITQVVLTLQAKEAATGKIELSYIAQDAGWIPTYDIRSEGLTSSIQLTYKAKVFQMTGLNWDNVKLTISTNNPYLNKTKPTLHPWYIDYYTYLHDGFADAPIRKMEMKDMEYRNALSVAGSSANDEAVTSASFVSSIKQLTSVEFNIDLSYSIPSTGESSIVFIKQTELNASYTYYAVPKLDESVYLIASVSKLEDLGLVPAAANIFFDGAYIGETYIDPTLMSDTLQLSLGRDPNIQVKRKLDQEASKERIIGDKKERKLAYSIEMKNAKATDINLIVEDQLPLTTNGEIQIELGNTDKATFNAQNGTLLWRISLKSKESKTLHFDFSVKHKKDQQINL